MILVVRNLEGSHRRHRVLSRHYTYDTAHRYIALSQDCDRRRMGAAAAAAAYRYRLYRGNEPVGTIFGMEA